MKTRRLLMLGSIALSLALPAVLRAGDDEFVVRGTIEQIESDGRLRVDHHLIRVDEDTEITDRLYRKVSPHELTPGVEVDIVCEYTSRGEHARNLVATVMR